jgi:hypothetical protein
VSKFDQFAKTASEAIPPKKSNAGAKPKKSIVTLQTIAWYHAVKVQAIEWGRSRKPFAERLNGNSKPSFDLINEIVAASVYQHRITDPLNRRYLQGEVAPASDKLDEVEKVFPGTKAVFMRGPPVLHGIHGEDSDFAFWTPLAGPARQCLQTVLAYEPANRPPYRSYGYFASADPHVKVEYLLKVLGSTWRPQDIDEHSYVQSGNKLVSFLSFPASRHQRITIKDLFLIMAVHRVTIDHLDRTTWWATAVMLEALMELGVFERLLKPWGLESIVPAYFAKLCWRFVSVRKLHFLEQRDYTRFFRDIDVQSDFGLEPASDQKILEPMGRGSGQDPSSIPFYPCFASRKHQTRSSKNTS